MRSEELQQRHPGTRHLPTPPSKSSAAPRFSQSFEDFAMSTQEVASFFDDDDDNMSFGSPPIAV
jgi:hypothetical protein